jgi:hypothetical protein
MRFSLVVAVATVLLLASACTGSKASDGGHVSGPLMISEGSSEDGMAAEVNGVVALRDGCILVDDNPAVWPEDTSWDAENRSVRLPNGASVALGQQVYGGGGYYDDMDVVRDLFGDDVADKAAPCLGDTGEVAVFNPGSDVEAASTPVSAQPDSSRTTKSASPSVRISSPSPAATPEAPTTAHAPAEGTRCSSVWLPKRGVGEADFGIDAAQGLLDIHFSATRGGTYRNFGYTVAYLADPSCRSTQAIAELIDRVNPPGWEIQTSRPRACDGHTLLVSLGIHMPFSA